MNVVLPRALFNAKNSKDYVKLCNKYLTLYKDLLYKHLNKTKLILHKQRLENDSNIQKIYSGLNMNLIIDTYINNLKVIYNSRLDICYYDVPEKLKCPGTNTSMKYVIKALEYGDELYPPLYWIRLTYKIFKLTLYGLRTEIKL